MCREKCCVYRLNTLCYVKHLLGSWHVGSWIIEGTDSSGHPIGISALSSKENTQASSTQICFSHSQLPSVGCWWWWWGGMWGKMNLPWFPYFLNNLHLTCQESLSVLLEEKKKKTPETNVSLHLCRHHLLWAGPICQDHCNGLFTYPRLLFLLFYSQSVLSAAAKSNPFTSQILSFGSFRWRELWMVTRVHQSRSWGPDDDSSSHTTLPASLQTSLSIPTQCYCLGF